MLLARLVARAANEPDRIALLQGEVRLTYGEFVGRIAGAAAKLRDAGVVSGDRILLSAANSISVPVLYFAIHASGGVAVMASPDTPPLSLAAIARQAAAKMALLDRAIPELDLRTLVVEDLASEVGPVDFTLPHPSDVADLLFTSGTTGSKKGVVLTHANILAAGRNISDFLQVRTDDIQAVPLPLSHSFGLGCVRSMAWVGHCLLIERGLINPAAMLKRMAKVGATGLAIVPSGLDVIRRMTGERIGDLAQSLRFVELGSAPITQEARSWLMERLPSTRLGHHYGMTEASRAVYTEYHADAHRGGTVGRASGSVTIKILDEGGSPVSVGETGEIAIAGDVVMSGYWRNPELSAAKIGPHGFMTGDVGSLDTEGNLFLLGRRDDLINVGGRKVAPEEVEDLLRQHPTIIDAACVATEDGILGQAVAAYVVRRAPIEDQLLLDWLRPQLEDYKLPRVLVGVDAIPRTDSGKIQRHLLRSRA